MVTDTNVGVFVSVPKEEEEEGQEKEAGLEASRFMSGEVVSIATSARTQA